MSGHEARAGTVTEPRSQQPDGANGSGARPSRLRWAILLAAGLPALCVGLLFAWWVVVPHLRFRYHLSFLASEDQKQRREAARALARLGTEEAVRALLMEIRSGIEKAPEEPDEIEEGESSFLLPAEYGLLLDAFREADPAVLPVFVDFLCSGDVREYGAAIMAWSAFMEARGGGEDSETASDSSPWEDLGMSPDLVARARACCEKMEAEKTLTFGQEAVDK